jgi:serine protease
VIENDYIVQIVPSSNVVQLAESLVNSQVVAMSAESSGPTPEIVQYYSNAFTGFQVKNTPLSLLHTLVDSDQVIRVEQNQYAGIFEYQNQGLSEENWALDYLSWPQDRHYEYDYDGSGVDVYILDTGITIDHVDFNVKGTERYRAVCDHDVINEEGLQECVSINCE